MTSSLRPFLYVAEIICSVGQTIGMLIESMAGKSGALHGTFQVIITAIEFMKPLICYVFSFVFLSSVGTRR